MPDLPMPGGDPNSWGTKLNTFLTDIPVASVETALGQYAGPWRGPHDCREWGIVADDNDHASDFATMVSELASVDNRAVQLVDGVIPVDATISCAVSGLRLIGAGGMRTSTQGGTRLLFSGTGPLIEIGADDGFAHDASLYTGPQFTAIENVNLQCNVNDGGTTALENGKGNYRAGTYAIRDWRGGDIQLRNVLAENFDYSFWGVCSDLNTFLKFEQRYSHSGIYIGPRSDQFTILAYYGFYNDTALHVDGAHGVRIYGASFVDDGGASSPPIKLGSEWVRGSNNICFDDCWFEHYDGVDAALDAWLEIGVGSTYPVNHVTIRTPNIYTQANGVDSHVNSLAQIGNANAVTIENPAGTSLNNLDQLVEFVGVTSPTVRIVSPDIAGVATEYVVTNSGSGSPQWFRETWGNGVRKMSGGGNAQLWIKSDGRVGANADAHSTLHSGGSLAAGLATVTATTAPNAGHHTILADATSGAITVNLPTAVGIAGRHYIIKKIDNANNVVVDGSSTQTIDGATTKTITTQYGFLQIVSDGANWLIVAQGGTIT